MGLQPETIRVQICTLWRAAMKQQGPFHNGECLAYSLSLAIVLEEDISLLRNNGRYVEVPRDVAVAAFHAWNTNQTDPVETANRILRERGH